MFFEVWNMEESIYRKHCSGSLHGHGGGGEREGGHQKS